MNIQKVGVTCASCGHAFDGEIVVDAPISVALESMRALRCPVCRSGSDKLLLGRKDGDGFKITDADAEVLKAAG